MKLVKEDKTVQEQKKVSDKEAEDAFRTILAWMGEDPNREGLLETPKRVTKAFKEYFKGYHEDPRIVLDKTFGDVDGYDDMVVQKNISVQSFGLKYFFELPCHRTHPRLQKFYLKLFLGPHDSL